MFIIHYLSIEPGQVPPRAPNVLAMFDQLGDSATEVSRTLLSQLTAPRPVGCFSTAGALQLVVGRIRLFSRLQSAVGAKNSSALGAVVQLSKCPREQCRAQSNGVANS